MIEHRHIYSYLLAHGLITEQDLVEGEVSVLDAARRNSNFIIKSSHGHAYLVKQGADEGKAATLANEAFVYKIFGRNQAHSHVAKYVPRAHFYDEEEHVLVLELLQHSSTWTSYHRRVGRFPVQPAAGLGRALAVLHQLDVAGDFASHESAIAEAPWVLSLPYPNLTLFKAISNANIELIKLIHSFPQFCAYLDQLYQGWRAQALIHSDIKWDNCLVCSPPSRRGKPQLKLVDWELARIGDPCWDIGSAFCGYLNFWLDSIPMAAGDRPEQYLELARYPLDKMQPAMRAFWLAYTQEMGLDAPTASEWLLRSAGYAAARLVQEVFEQSQTSARLAGNVPYYLQVSLNMLQRPHDAVLHLLGIPSLQLSTL